MKHFDNEDYESVSSFSEQDQDKYDPEFMPPTSQVTNAKRKLNVENKRKYSKIRKIQTSWNKNAHKEQDDSSDY